MKKPLHMLTGLNLVDYGFDPDTFLGLVKRFKIGKENGNVGNKIFQSFALVFSFGRFFCKGKFAGSKIENIAFNFRVFKKLEHFVIFRLDFFFLVHGEH